MSYRLELGDALELLRGLPDGSVDALVTDPPAGIGFMNAIWDGDKGGRDAWIAWLTEVMAECLRVMKPGAHGLVWALPRTSHWTGTALESAGFEVRDTVFHVFGSGFPKSLDVSKAIDRAAGAEREVVGTHPYANRGTAQSKQHVNLSGSPEREQFITAPATPEAAQWEGWGTALKPAAEVWWLVRKPLEGNVAANVLKHGTGALNIDGCRIGTESTRRTSNAGTNGDGWGMGKKANLNGSDSGRFPSHFIHDGSPEVLELFPETESGTRKSGEYRGMGYMGAADREYPEVIGDSGSAARFFYCSKASKADRTEGGRVANPHPTVKASSLMRYLCRLVTPPGGVVLDPFMGSGSTGKAAIQEGFKFIGIDNDPTSYETAQRRLEAVSAQGRLEFA